MGGGEKLNIMMTCALQWQAYLQNMPGVDDVSIAKLCPSPSTQVA